LHWANNRQNSPIIFFVIVLKILGKITEDQSRVNIFSNGKGLLRLKNKLFLVLLSALLSGFMLAGCNNNDDDQNPPPPVNDNTPLDDDNNLDGNDNDDDLNNTNTRYNDDNRLNNTNTRYNNNHYPEREDINMDNDKDPGKDNNTPREDIIEDDIDVNDRDRKDE